MDSFQGKIAIVTGGASGIGRALGQELSRRGAVVVLADINERGVHEVASALRAAGDLVEGAGTDVTDAEAVRRLVDATVAKHGRLDYLFNNAGIAVFGEERDVSLADYRRVMDINFWGVVHGVRVAYNLMAKQGCGHIVNTASLAGLIPVPLEVSYTASKHAVVGLSLALRAEGAALGVRVSVVCPGVIDTAIISTSEVQNLDRNRTLEILKSGGLMPADLCARKILRGVERNRAVIVIKGDAHLLWWLTRISPTAALWASQRFFVPRFRALRLVDR